MIDDRVSCGINFCCSGLILEEIGKNMTLVYKNDRIFGPESLYFPMEKSGINIAESLLLPLNIKIRVLINENKLILAQNLL